VLKISNHSTNFYDSIPKGVTRDTVNISEGVNSVTIVNPGSNLNFHREGL